MFVCVNLLPHPPVPFPMGRGNFSFYLAERLRPLHPASEAVARRFKGKLGGIFRFAMKVLQLPAWCAIALCDAETIPANFMAVCKILSSDAVCRGRSHSRHHITPAADISRSRRARPASEIGQSGRRNSSRHSPSTDRAVLTGMGLTSENSARISGR